jgi:hypothetical protein
VPPEVASAAWCPVCFTAIEEGPAGPVAASSTFGALPPVGQRTATPASLPASSIRSVGPWRDRWSSTDLTFGVTGRIVATAVWTVPYVFFYFAGLTFGLVGTIAFTPVWVRGIRDLWRRADRMTADRSHRRGTSSQGKETREGSGHPRR